MQKNLYVSDHLLVRGSGAVQRYEAQPDGGAKAAVGWRDMGPQDGIMVMPGGTVTVIATPPDGATKATDVGGIGDRWDGQYCDTATGQSVAWWGKSFTDFDLAIFGLRFWDSIVRVDRNGVMVLMPGVGVGTGVLQLQQSAKGFRNPARTARRCREIGAVQPFSEWPEVYMREAAKQTEWPPPPKPVRQRQHGWRDRYSYY